MIKIEKQLDESKQIIIDDFLKRKDEQCFKWFKIQAWPWTWKTFLLKKILEKLSKELKEQNIFALSFSNSAIDTISTKLLDQKKNNIEIKTIASFFIENFVIPFGYTILMNEKLNLDEKKLLNKVSNNFSENNLTNWGEWGVLNWIIKKYCEGKYFDLFYNIIIQKNIRYIFVDEYQDTQNYCVDVFNKIIEKWDIKFFCVWDKNQQINYEKNNIAFNWLEEKTLETTYRFWQTILDYTNKILDSWIRKTNEGSLWGVNFLKDYKPITWSDDKRYENLCNYIISLIKKEINTFKWKNTVILFQPTTDNGFWIDFNKKLNNLLENDSEISFAYTEKPVYNIHLKLFFEKVIAFVNGDKNVRYSEIEKELDFFYERWNEKENYRNVFFEILKLKYNDKIKKISNLLKHWFKKWWNYKEYFDQIYNLLDKWNTTFEMAKNKQLIEIIDIREDDKIYISTNTITSAKWKEYDNVIILWIYKTPWSIVSFKKMIEESNESSIRHYYVAVSRAKENVFTFVDYGFW